MFMLAHWDGLLGHLTLGHGNFVSCAFPAIINPNVCCENGVFSIRIIADGYLSITRDTALVPACLPS